MKGILITSSSLPKIIVLMYHRIEVTATDPWDICVSPTHFEEQVEFLKNNFNIIGLNNLVKQVSTGNITGKNICITFDDGYANNYINAKPILENYNCPATFFIPTAFINQTTLFWWDELEFILLHSKKLPANLSLNIAGENYNYILDEHELTHEQWQLHANWKWYDEPLTKRCEVFLKTWQKIRTLPYKELERQMFMIRKWAGINDNHYTLRLPLSEQQLLELSKNNLFSIALHTHTHPDLQSQEKHSQVEEILSCKKMLFNKYNLQSNCLAYPYGSYNNDTIETVNELQLDACFTTEAVCIDINSDLKKLGRYQVCDWNLATFKEQLTEWMK